MINLTAQEIAIIKSDATTKNFRVHFPNGEYSDLDNNDIVFGSVKFTESVCSEEYYRYGCYEASVIEFETVGVANIVGCEIECTMDFIGASTVSIPYGRFVVDKCPRNHQSMTHRKITAYSKKYTNDLLPPLERWKMSRLAYVKTYQMNPYYFLAQMGLTSPTTVSAITGSTGSNSYLAYYNGEDGQTIIRQLRGFYPANAYQEFDISDLNAVYRITLTGSLSSLYAILEAHNVPKTSLVVSATLSIKNTNLNEVRYHIPLRDNGDGTITCDIVYPNCPQIGAGATVKIYVPLSIEVRYSDTEAPANNWDETAVIASAVSVEKLTSSATEAGITLVFKSTLQNTGYYYFDAYSAEGIISGFAELMGGLVRTNRDGSIEYVYLDNSDPYALDSSDVMSSAWWDEYTVEPVGTVVYDFVKDNQQQTGEYEFSSDGSIYDMSGNYILNHLANPTASYIESTLLRYLFRPKAGALVFTPFDSNLIGMPFLQCGDAIEFTAQDGAVINSYLLSQSFTGEQLIVQDVNTVQGEVLND